MNDEEFKAHVLLVDDDSSLSELLNQYLSANNIIITEASSAEHAIEILEEPHDKIDLVVLDIMMPGMSGLEFLPIMASRWGLPVILLTGRGDDIDRILGLEMGADDYIGKPCNPRELLARIRAVLRRYSRSSQGTESMIRVGDVLVDCGKRKAFFKQSELDVTIAEFNVLAELMSHAGSAVSREQLTQRVLHRELTPYDRSIDVHVSRVRNALRLKTNSLEDHIVTIRGIGYQFVNP